MANNVTLVTGASGFLGHAVMRLLAQNAHRAIGLDTRALTTTQALDDLSDRARLQALLTHKKITHIIHAGGVSGPVVMADELGNFYESEPIGEDYPLRPTSTYSASKAAVDMVLRGLWGKVPLDLCSLRFTVIYGPGRETVFTIEKIVGAALAGKVAQIEPMTDWPYVYIDDAAQAAVSACFAQDRKQLGYFIAYPEKVTPDDIAAAAAAAGKPVRLEIDNSKPLAARGPVDTDAPARDFGFRAKLGHREGIRRVIEAAQ